MSVERILVLTGFEEHVCAMQTIVNANVERKVSLKDTMTTVSEQLECGCNINKWDYSVKMARET